jgi:hypothetical protein
MGKFENSGQIRAGVGPKNRHPSIRDVYASASGLSLRTCRTFLPEVSSRRPTPPHGVESPFRPSLQGSWYPPLEGGPRNRRLLATGMAFWPLVVESPLDRPTGRMPLSRRHPPEADRSRKCSSSSGSIPTWNCWQNHRLRCSYLGDTRRFGPCTRTTPGVVPKTISSSPSGATNKPNDAPSARTVYVPEQSGLTV